MNTDDGEAGMGLHVHRSERTDTLLSGLAALLAQTPADPFAVELVAVPTPGIERFITQSLGQILGSSPGRTDGVCANISFESPTALVNRVVALASGLSTRDDPWSPQRLVWPVLTVIDDAIDQPWASPLAMYLSGTGVDRRFALASHCTDLFTQYASQRPQLLLEWLAGSDTAPADLAWQPPMVRMLRELIGTPGPAERLDTACAALAADASVADLPARLCVFGATRLPAGHLRVLRAISTHLEVHLWLADPSPVLWQRLSGPMHSQRSQDPSAAVVHNPLLASLGRDSRELAVRLLQPASTTDDYTPSPLSEGTLLGALQRQLRDDIDPWSAPSVRLAEADRSVQVHACHGQARQAEVVREVILGMLQDDPSLEPRDVLVMCPNLAAFAPLLTAAFATTTQVRLRVADRTPEQSNEVLGALAALLDLVTGRAQLSAVLDFVARTPVRRRFGFDDESLERLETLTADAGIRWGLDERQRQEFSLPVAQGTWRWGVDRLLLGVAMSEDGLAQLDGVLPVDDVNSNDIVLVGRLGELVTRLERLRTLMVEPHSVQEWGVILREAIDDLTQLDWADEWQHTNALGALGALLGDAGAGSTALRLADVRWLLGGLLTGRPTRANFRSGDLTVCGLAPMRSVPHKVICLVGLDDAEFPRATTGDGDSVLARDPLIGERDVRSEDRQVLLDAIMAAANTLVVTYTGADERTNEPRPPCVPLAGVLDTLDAMTDGCARDAVCVTHPLQPFDARNFTPSALGGGGPFSHDPMALTAARRAAEPRVPSPAWRFADLPEIPVSEVSLRDLSAFLCSPPAAFLRARLGVSLRDVEEPAPERLPIELNGLEKWAIGARSLHLLTRSEPVARIAAAERARGTLPPGVLGDQTLSEVGRDAADVATRFSRLRDGEPRQVSITIDLPNGVRLTGTVSDVYGRRIVRATYAKGKPRDDLRLWPDLLALAVTEASDSFSAHLVAKDGDRTLISPPADQALLILSDLVDLYRTGLHSPLPLMPATSQLYAKRRASGASISAAVRAADFGCWRSRYAADREAVEVVRLWGRDPDLSQLLAQKPADNENWFDEVTRFGMLARRLWQPVLDAGGGR